ncbi:MAG: DUF11 domain-containing protein, partial [Candidatus Subteraquimicrobiales bacterium]|nr:DUF11 domain-containing protein [Candidatus Subteraquimicrobiales bacterium]
AYTRASAWDFNNVPTMLVTVWNAYSNLSSSGLNDATNVVVDYVLPSGLEYQGHSTRGFGTAVLVVEDGKQILRWTVPHIPAGGLVTLVVLVKITGVGNQTTVAQFNRADQSNLGTAPSVARMNVTVGSTYVDIGVNQTVDNLTPIVGSNVTFIIQATNNGPYGSSSVNVTAKLPAGLKYLDHWISYNNGDTWVQADLAYNNVSGVWTIGNYPYSTTPLLLKITANVTQSSNISFTVSKTSKYDWNWDNNAQSVYLTGLPVAELLVEQSVDDNVPVLGQYVTLTVNVSNNGPSNATGVQISEKLPYGLTFVSSTPSQGSYNSGTGVWDIGTINYDTTATLT